MSLHIESLKSNIAEVDRLLEIHTQLTGDGAGRKYEVEVLNKSGIVLLLACWEAYIEDLAASAFDFMLARAQHPSIFPEHVLAIAAEPLKKATSPVIWNIAKDGWKAELKKHRDRVLQRYVVENSFNTPSAQNIDRLFSELIGLTSLSKEWVWPHMTCERAREKLAELISLRGSIAHRVRTAKTVRKSVVTDYKSFLYRLAVIASNRSAAFLNSRVGERPWKRYVYAETR